MTELVIWPFPDGGVSHQECPKLPRCGSGSAKPNTRPISLIRDSAHRHLGFPTARPRALVAQGIEHRFPKPGVGGSSPPEGATGNGSSRLRYFAMAVVRSDLEG